MVSFSPALLREAENFTLFIKNSISFPRFEVNRFVGKRAVGRWLQEAAAAGLSCLSPLLLLLPLWAPGVGCGRGISGAHEGSAELRGTVGTSQLAHCRCQCPLPHRRNLVDEVNATYLKRCLYHKISHPLCPVFHLGYVARESGQSFSTLAEKVLCQGSGEGWARDRQANQSFSGPVNPPPASPCGLSIMGLSSNVGEAGSGLSPQQGLEWNGTEEAPRMNGHGHMWSSGCLLRSHCF